MAAACCAALSCLTHICRAQWPASGGAAHDLSQAARHTGEVICLGGGGVMAQGHPGDILRSDLLRRLYGVHVEVMTGRDGGLHITPLAAVEA